MLQKLEECLSQQDLSSIDLMISGDFNARTASAIDYTDNNNDVPYLIEFSELFDGDLGISRTSQD